MQAIFVLSIAVILLHKIISCGAIYALTRNITDVFLQLIDFMMIKAIYLNYKLQTNEPGNAQRYLQILEGTFESGPQILISILFITKTYNPEIGVDPIILVSSISSIWTVTTRVTSDDKFILHDEWRSIYVDGAKYPYINHLNWRYFVRVIFWRFFEISTRVFILVLFWIAVGGFALTIIIIFELVLVFILCLQGEGVIVLGNMMYFTMAAVGSIKEKWLDLAAAYKFLSPLIYLSLITVFSTQSFETWKVEDYTERHDIIENRLKFTMLIYSWIATSIYLCTIQYIIIKGRKDIASVRSCDALLVAGEYVDVLNLIEFGSPYDSIYPVVIIRNQPENVLLHIAQQESNNHAKTLLFRKLCETDPEQTQKLITEVDREMELNCLGYAARHDLDIVKYLIEEMEMHAAEAVSPAIKNEQHDILLYLFKNAGADIVGIDDNAIYSMVSRHAYELIRFLISADDDLCKSFLQVAIERLDLEFIRKLKDVWKQYINFTIRNEWGDNHYLHQILEATVDQTNEVVEDLKREQLFRFFIDELRVNPVTRNDAGQTIISVIVLKEHFRETIKSDEDKKTNQIGVQDQKSQRSTIVKYLIEEKNVDWNHNDNREIGIGGDTIEYLSDTLNYLAKVVKSSTFV